MTDLIRTKYGRIQCQGKNMSKHATLTCYFKRCYEKLFSPFVRKTCDLVQNSMGYHSEVIAYFKVSSFLENMKWKIK